MTAPATARFFWRKYVSRDLARPVRHAPSAYTAGEIVKRSVQLNVFDPSLIAREPGIATSAKCLLLYHGGEFAAESCQAWRLESRDGEQP